MKPFNMLSIAFLSLAFGCDAHIAGFSNPLAPTSNQAPPVRQGPTPEQLKADEEQKRESDALIKTAMAKQDGELKQKRDQMHWYGEYTKDTQAKGLSCQTIKALKTKADTCPFDNIKGLYATLIESQTKEAMKRLATEGASDKYIVAAYYESGDQADGLHTGEETPEGYTARMKASNVEELKCFGRPDVAAKLVELLDEYQKESVEIRSKEAACRKNKKCIVHRENLKAGEGICDLIAAIKMSQEQIRNERANPSGVVSLTTLHENGENIQMSRVQLKDAKAEFRSTYKREFPESICQEIWSRE